MDVNYWGDKRWSRDSDRGEEDEETCESNEEVK